MKTRLLGICTVVLAGGAIAGCGGSSSGGSYSAFSNSANSICQDATKTLKSLSSLHPTSLTQVVDPLNTAIGEIGSVIDKFNALKGPSALGSARDAYVSDLSTLKDDMSKAADAAKANNASNFASTLSGIPQLEAKAKADGAKLGAPDCVK